jgi:hypothetical protein
MTKTWPFLLCALILIVSGTSFAQDDRVVINKSLVPAEGDEVSKFVPSGWKIEEQLKGDLNGDSVPDYVVKLVEDKPPKDKDDNPNERQRTLLILLQKENGKLSRAAVADRLLQCTTCGGAFYGISEAPANVTIDRGAIVIEQDHGSRWTSDLTYRFRYESASGKFLLIGFDYVSNDRATAQTVTESTNFLTGLRIVKRSKNRVGQPTMTRFAKNKIYIDDVDTEKFEAEVTKRLHLD